jgi:hypothetical protein
VLDVDSARAESIGEAQEVLFLILIEDRHYRVLDDLTPQGDAQGTLPSVSLWYVGSSSKAARDRSRDGCGDASPPASHPVRLVLLPGHPIDSECSIPLQSVVAVRSSSVVTWWSSALNRVCLSLRATSRTACKSLNSLVRLWVRGRGRLPDVLLGRLPSMPSAGACSPLVIESRVNFEITLIAARDSRFSLVNSISTARASSGIYGNLYSHNVMTARYCFMC